MSVLTFLNTTNFIAQFVVNKGEQVVARLPGIAPGAKLEVPSTDNYTVTATTLLEGNTYTSTPADVTGPMSFTAQVKQNLAQGTYDFEMVVGPSSSQTQMEFQKTSINPVTFNISKNDVPLQSVTVSNSFVKKTVTIGSTYTFYAVVDGVTTEAVETSNLNAIVTAVTDDTYLEGGYFTVSVA